MTQEYASKVELFEANFNDALALEQRVGRGRNLKEERAAHRSGAINKKPCSFKQGFLNKLVANVKL